MVWCGFALDATSEDECITKVVVAIGELSVSIDEYLDSVETDAVRLWEEQKMLDIGEEYVNSRFGIIRMV